jgi:RNA polymerase sigma factor (sigma-70 family)
MATPPLGAVLQHLRKMVRPRPVAALSDGQLLLRFLRWRDEDAFAALVERHGPLVLGVCRRVLPEGHDAEDAFQATFLVLVRKASSLNRDASLASWLYTVACRLALKIRVQSARRRAREQEVGEMRSNEAPGVSDVADLLPLLDEELHALPEKYRAPLLLCYLQGKTNGDAARELGWRPGSMSRRLARGRELLRQRLVKRGVALTAAGLALFLTQRGTAALPAALVAETVRVGLLMAGGATLAGTVSARIAVLVEGAVKEMFLLKLKVVAAVLLVFGIAGAGAAVRPESPAAPPAPPATETPAQPPAPPTPKPEEEPAKKATADLQGDPLPAGALTRLGTIRLRHGGPVGGVAFSPNGKTAVTGGGFSDNILRLWDTDTGRELRSFKGHTYNITGLAFTPDGKHILSCAQDQTARLWDVATGAEVRQFKGHEAGVSCLALAPDGKTAATGSQDGTARLWDVATGAEKSSLAHNASSVHGVAFSSDGKSLATAAEDGSVHVWETATGKELHNLSAHGGGALCVVFAPDGKALVSGGRQKTIRFWDVATGKELRNFDVGASPVQCLAFAPDGKALAVGIQAKPALLLLDPVTGKPLQSLESHGGTLALAFAPDGKTLLTGSNDHAARFLDVTTGKECFPLPGHHSYVGNPSFSPDGQTLRTVGQDQTVRIWDLTGKEVRHFGAGLQRGKSTAYSPDGKLVATAGASGIIRVWNLATGKKLREIGKNEGTINALAWSDDGKALATGGIDGRVCVWDAVGGKQLHNLSGPQGSVWALRFSPDGKVLAAGRADKTIHLWDLTTGKERHHLTGPQGEIESVAFSPDGRTLAVGPRGTTIWIWNTETGRLLTQLNGHSTWIYAVEFSPSGQTLASGSLDNTVRLWETATWKERARFEGHRGGVVSLAFSPDGRSLASGSADSSVLVWDLTGRLRDGRLALAKLSAELEVVWGDLAGPDAARGYRALWRLAAAPVEALPLLRESLRPVAVVSAERMKRLIADLDDDDFNVREKATDELAKLGGVAEDELRKALTGTPSAELKQRVQHLLDGQRAGPGPAQIRQTRALEVLEGMGTPEARKLLEELAKGAPGAALTEESKGALQRIDKRTEKR